MNSTIKLIFLMMISFLAWGQKDEKLFYKSGKLQMEFKYEQNCDCHIVTEYFENGQILSRRTYKNGSLHGEDIRYFGNGKIQLYYNWNNGIME